MIFLYSSWLREHKQEPGLVKRMCTMKPTGIVGGALDFITGTSIILGTSGLIVEKVGLKGGPLCVQSPCRPVAAVVHVQRGVGIGSYLDCQLQNCLFLWSHTVCFKTIALAMFIQLILSTIL